MLYLREVKMIIGKMKFYRIWKDKYSSFWKKRRFNKIMGLIKLPEKERIKVLEVGCSNGRDFIQFLPRNKFEIWGADIDSDCGAGADIHFVTADAADLPFDDGEFDLVVSIGLLEHIEPVEKLCRVIREMERVGTHQLSVVPSVATLLEPHSGRVLFPLRIWREMMSEQPSTPLHLNFYTEHTWTKFTGFTGCEIKRFFYIPPFITNTVIYK